MQSFSQNCCGFEMGNGLVGDGENDDRKQIALMEHQHLLYSIETLLFQNPQQFHIIQLKSHILTLYFDQRCALQQMSLQRSNTNKSGGDVSEHSTAEANHFLQKAVKVMRQLTQAEKSLRGLQNEIKIKKLTEINRNLQLAARKDPHCIAVLVQNKVLVYIKHFFAENVTKAPALAFLRLLMPAQNNASLYLAHNVPLLLARVLQREENRQRGGDWEEEAVQALKLMAEWVQRFPMGLPRLLATALVSFGQLPATVGFEEKKKDHISQHLKLLAIDIILSLTAKNLELALQAGAFSLLVTAVTDHALQQRSQDILIRLLYFMNERKTRQKVWAYVDLRKLFYVFTDLDYVFFEENSKNKGNVQFCGRLQTQLSLARQALLTLLKSWTGIILLAQEGSILSTILEALKQVPKKQDSQVRKVIYGMLEEILTVGQGLLGGEFVQGQNDFRASSLLSSYMVALLRLLMDHGLFKLLIELSGTDEPAIAEPAQRLLKKLSIYIFNFLPDAANYMDFLVSAGTKCGAGSAVLKHSSSFIVSKIGNFVFDAHKEYRNSFLGEIEYIFNLDSIFMPLSRTSILAISKNLNFLAYREVPNYRRKLLDLRPIPKEHKQNFKKWDWNAIIDLLSFPDVEKQGGKPDSADRYKQFKLFKYLLRFYSYSRGNFAEQKWSTQNLPYLKAGKLLIQNTLMIPDNLALVKNPPESQFQCTISFMGELQKLLDSALQAFGNSPCKYYAQFFKTFQRQLILWIGSFSHTKVGYQTLICQNHFFEIMQNYLQKKECVFVIAGVLFYFDFYRDNLMKRYREKGQEQTLLIGPRALLAKCVKMGSKSLKLMSIQIIKLLYRAELTGFTAEGLKLLISLVLDSEEEIWTTAVQTVENLIKNRQLLQSFLAILIECEVQSKVNFGTLKERLSANILIRLCELEEGYKLIESKMQGWLQAEYDRWVTPQASQKYFDHLQNLLSNCLSFSRRQYNGYKIETQGKDFIRWAFLYKLPWLLSLNQAEQVPLLVKLSQDTLLLYAEFQDEEYEFRSTNPENILKVCLGIGSIFLDEELNPTKTKCHTSINLNSNSLVTLYGQQYYCASHRGVSVYFLLKPQGESFQEVSDSEAYANSYDIRRIHVEVKLSSFYSNEELPLHLIQQVTKTELGMQFLQKKQLTLHAKKVFQSKESSTLQVRSVLWSLGYYGSTNEGMKTLVKEGLADSILQLSVHSPTLSLRGTCRYVLNMFCHSEEGRNYLARNGLTVNKKLLSCAPNLTQKPYQLNDNPELHLSQNRQFWKEYSQNLSPLNENESKLFESISMLVNSLSSKYSIAQIKQLIKNNPKITFSFPLLQNVINLMSYFKMKYQARKTVHFIFEDFMKSTDFIAEGNGKINYPTKG